MKAEKEKAASRRDDLPARGRPTRILYRSPADWISPEPRAVPRRTTSLSLSSAYRGKVIVDDTDHLCGHTCGDTLWVWKCFCHGLNVLLMEDLSPSPIWQDSSRDAMGQVRKFFREESTWAQMVSSIIWRKHTIASPMREENIWFSSRGIKGEFTVNLSDALGTFAVEWLNASTGETVAGKPVKGGGVRTFPTPFGGPGVLY